MFDDLRRVLRLLRQNGHLFVPTTVTQDCIFDDLLAKIEGIEAAVTGTRHDDDQDTFLAPGQTRFMPPLSPSLKEHLTNALAEIEAQSVALHESIQRIRLRGLRNDPQARSEQELAARRKDIYADWSKLLNDLDDEVLDFWMEEKRSARLRLHDVGALWV